MQYFVNNAGANLHWYAAAAAAAVINNAQGVINIMHEI